MLDLVFSEADKDLIVGVEVHDVCVISPVHMVINFELGIMINSKQRRRTRFRNKRHLNTEELLQKIVDEISRNSLPLTHVNMAVKT